MNKLTAIYEQLRTTRMSIENYLIEIQALDPISIEKPDLKMPIKLKLEEYLDSRKAKEFKKDLSQQHFMTRIDSRGNFFITITDWHDGAKMQAQLSFSQLEEAYRTACLIVGRSE